MCIILHIASTHKIARVPWDEKDRHLCVEDLHGSIEHLRSHFTLPNIAYVGSSLGCGCGFRYVTLQNGGWPEEWMIENGEYEPPEFHIRDHQELHDLIVSLPGEGRTVELYCCWDGEESETTAHDENILPSRLLDGSFWFRERALYRIISSEHAPPAGRPRPGAPEARCYARRVGDVDMM